MVVALGPGRFYGSSLPRPRYYPDPKLNPIRVDPPESVVDPLLSWANEAHWTMGGLSFRRLRLQGRIEGSISKIRKSMSPNPKRLKTSIRFTKQRLASLEEEDAESDTEEKVDDSDLEEGEESEEVEEEQESEKEVEEDEESEEEMEAITKKRRVRRLGDEFDRIAEEAKKKEKVDKKSNGKAGKRGKGRVKEVAEPTRVSLRKK